MNTTTMSRRPARPAHPHRKRTAPRGVCEPGPVRNFDVRFLGRGLRGPGRGLAVAQWAEERSGHGCFKPRPADRRGAVLSLELLLIMPILVTVFLALVEFSLIWTANHQVNAASRIACRVGSLPADNVKTADRAVREAAARTLNSKKLIHNHRLSFEPGQFTGDPVTVEVRVPMEAAAPDLLSALGFSLKGRWLVGRTVMRKE